MADGMGDPMFKRSIARSFDSRSCKAVHDATSQESSVVHVVRDSSTQSVWIRAAHSPRGDMITRRPSQIQRHELPGLLTQGLRDNGMWDVVVPPARVQR